MSDPIALACAGPAYARACSRASLVRAAFGAARVAIHFDETVIEVHYRVVLHPVDTELHPIVRVSGLIEADERPNRLSLRRTGIRARLFQGVVGQPQIFRIEARRRLVIRRAGAVTLFDELAVRPFGEP